MAEQLKNSLDNPTSTLAETLCGAREDKRLDHEHRGEFASVIGLAGAINPFTTEVTAWR